MRGLRYVVVVRAPSGAEEGPLRIFGPWRSQAAAEAFADAVGRKTDAAYERAQTSEDYGQQFHRARVMLLREPRLRGPGGAYEWAT